MKRIYLSPMLSLALIAVVSVGAGWMVLSTAQKVSQISDNFTSIEPTPQADSAEAKKLNATTEDQSHGIQQAQ